MKRSHYLALASAAALLGGCEMKIGNDDGKKDGQTDAAAPSAEGKAEEGKVAIKAPGFDLKLNIPTELAENAKVDHKGELLYPGSTLSGLYIAGGEGGKGSEVELRFKTADEPAKVAAWYRDPARSKDFTLDSATQDGAGFALAGKEAKGRQSFKLRLDSAGSGGTDGRLTLRERG